jgi:RNA polymerase sigma-70 factor (family 1)
MKIDSEIICRLQGEIASDNQKAFKELYCLFFAKLFNFAISYVHKKEIAEELVNDVMVKVWNKRQVITEIQHLETYLFVAIRNHSLNYLSSYSSYHVAIDREGNQAKVIQLNDPEKELEWKEISFQLDKTIAQLPGQCRTVFKLIREEGLRYKQVAEILNISPRTVETQLFRAMRKLDKVIQAYHGKHNVKTGKVIF